MIHRPLRSRAKGPDRFPGRMQRPLGHPAAVRPSQGVAALVKTDQLEVYLQEGNDLFQDNVLKPLGRIVKELRIIRDYNDTAPVAVDAPAFEQHRAKFAQILDQLDGSIFAVHEEATRAKRRNDYQLRKLKDKLTKLTQKSLTTCQSKPKSKKRQAAGKRAAASLDTWRSDFSKACKTLKEEGYRGSLNVRKGGAVFKKIQEMKKDRLVASFASVNSSASCPSAPDALPSDAEPSLR